LSVPAFAGSNRSYRPDIDGIRSIAILSVVLYHAGVPWITGGFTGVDIFFVISGYLIGGHIFSEVRHGNFSFLRFYQRRAKRILPAFYGVLIFTILAAMVLLSPGEASVFGRYAFAATLSVSNMFFWHYSNYFDTRSTLYPLLMTWSLGVEEQFYAVVPLLMVLVARIRRSLLLPAILIVCILSFLLAWHELGTYPMNVFYLLPERAWELGVGVALAVMELTRRPVSWPKPLVHLAGLCGLALLLAPMFLLNAKSAFPGPAALPSVLGAALMIAFPGSWINQQILSLPPLVFIGKISYSWYLWHWPLLSFLRVASEDQLPPMAALLAVALSLAAAVLSYYLIEQPLRRSTRPAGPLLIRYAMVSLLVLSLCTGVWLSHGIPQRFPELAEIERAAEVPTTDPCLTAHAKLNLKPPCYDASDPRPSVALWGDSHSAALAPGLRSIANAQGYAFVQLGQSGCLPLTGAANRRPNSPLGAQRCMEFNRRSLRLLQADHRVRIVVLAGRWMDSFRPKEEEVWLVTGSGHPKEVPTPDTEKTLFKRFLVTSVQDLQAAGKQVVVLEDVPNFNFDPLLRIRTTHIATRRVLATWMGSLDASDPGSGPADNSVSMAIANTQLRAALDVIGVVPLIDLKPEFCSTGNQCAYRDGDRLFYFDSQHLTEDGAHYALRDFRLPAVALSGE
jgi:peptidoglycan/LPS O-acetylase OafA/YrhL